MKKITLALMSLTGMALTACNNGANQSGQSVTASPITANTAKSLFATSSCLTGKVNFSGNSTWYLSGSVDITNTCSSEQSLAGQTVSFTSQDANQKGIAVGTLNNWWINNTAYKLVFTSGSGNTQVGTITSDNNNPIIAANQTISFNGGLNLSGSAYNSSLASSTFAINGGTPTPAESATMNVVVDTKNAGCSNNNACQGLTVNVTDSSGVKVASFAVESSSYGATYTQPIKGLTVGSAYTVSGSAISNATVAYTPAATQTIVKGTNQVTVTYTQNAPVVSTGSANVSFASYVPTYTGNISVQLINAVTESIINTYSVAQGSSFNTGLIPVSDATHVYKLKALSGIADPAKGQYYIESSILPTVTITKNTTTSSALPFVASSVANNNLTLAISGLNSGDTANVTFSDASGKYNYVQPTKLSSGSTSYKIESGLNLGVSVLASGSSYATNPLNSTQVVNKATTVTAAFESKPVSANTYDYTAGYQGGPGALITIKQNVAITNPKTAVITTNFNPTVGGNCFTSTWGGITSSTTKVGSSYQTTITANDSTDWSGKVTAGYLNLSVGCGLTGGATVLSGVEYGIVSGVSIDGSKLNITQPCSSTGCKDPGNGKILSGYYPDWARYGKKFPLSSVPFESMNEVLYAFIGFTPATGEVKSLDAWADQNEMPTLSKAMLQYPYMHATLSFGGWTNAGATTAPMFATLTSSDTAIANFTKQSVAAMRAAGYDGIDIDWEWWSDYTVAPTTQQIKLYTSLRNALDAASKEDGKEYRLTIAVSAGLDKIQATEAVKSGAWATIAGLVDNINVMAYDMHGAFDAKSDFQAPWGMETASPYASTHYDIQSAMNAYIAYGVPARKLVLGIPAYGRAMKVSSLDNYGLYQTVTGTPSGDYDDASSGPTGVFLYKCIINSAACAANGSTISALTFVSQGSSVFNQLSSQAQEPWGYGSTPQGNIFLTYDNVATVVYKTQKAKANGYGGVMVWEIDGDDIANQQNSLINAMKTELNK